MTTELRQEAKHKTKDSAFSIRVLLVDDAHANIVSTRELLSKMQGVSAQVEGATDCETALKLLAGNTHDVCLIDGCLGEPSGVELVREAVSNGCRVPLIFLVAQSDHNAVLEAMRAGASDFLFKSELNASLIERSIRYAIERRRAEDERAHSHSLLRATLESTADGILVVDQEGRITGYNHKFAEMWNVPSALLEAGDDARVLSWGTEQLENPDAFLDKVRQLYANPAATSFDVVRLRDGRVFERYSQPQLIGGQTMGRVWNFRDVSQRERDAEALRRSEAFKAAVLETALDCIITMDSEGRVIEWNPASEHTFGFSRSQALGQLMTEMIVPAALRKQHTAGIARYLATGESQMLGQRVEMPAVRADGSELVVELSVVQIPVEGENGPLFTAYLRDITERKQAEEMLVIRARHENGLAACSQALLAGGEPHDALNKALRHLLQASDVSRIYIFENFEDAQDGLCIKQTHEVCAPGVHPEIDNPELQHLVYSEGLARWQERLSNGGFIGGLVEEFPAGEREILEPQGILSILVLPIWAGGRWHGFIGFDDVWQKRSWDEINIQLLRTAASAIGAYLERRQVEDALRHRAQFQALIASISTAFIDLSSSEVDEGIERALRAIGEFSRVDRSYVFCWSGDGRTMNNTHEWCAPNIEPQRERLQNLPVAALPWICEQLRAFETVHIPRVRDLPEEARAEREEFEIQDIQSLVTVPMVYRSHLVGHIGFDSVRAEKTWSEDEIGLLRIAGEMFVNALERKRAEAEVLRLNESLELRVAERTRELEHANTQREQQRQRLADTLSNLPGLVFETWFQPDPPQGRVNFVSDYVTTMLGYSVEEWLSTPDFWLQRVHPNEQEILRQSMLSIFDNPSAHTRTFRMMAKDESVVWTETQVRVVSDAHGKPIGLRGLAMDITERKRAEAELQAAKDEADRANCAKSEFLSRMSHELRTPLNAILGFGQILELGDLSRSQRESVEHMLRAGRHLLDLINEVLDIARIEAGRLALSSEPTRISVAVNEVLDLARPLVNGRNITLVSEVSEKDGDIFADQQRLKQVLLNFVSNAVKYNRDGGSVKISCEYPTPQRMRLLISDTGPGLSEQEMKKLFTPFERLSATHTRIEGSGIGLALCKKLVEAMDGQIGVYSTQGQGSTFWFELPAAETSLETSFFGTHQQRSEANSPEALAELQTGVEETKSVLYIDDNLSNLRVIELLLSNRPDIQLLTAIQGSTGLDLAREHRPDLILLDLHLPDFAGDEVLRRLRAEPLTREIPVVMVSADATPREIERLLVEGASAYVTKPLDVQQLLQVMDAMLHKNEL